MVIGAITLIVITLGATYAYFVAQGGETGNINVNANTATTDNLSFQIGSAINLTASQEDFGEGAGNKSGSTYARATLTANNTTNNATRNYYVYMDITDNDFEYTTDDNQAEIILKVTAPDESEVTNIPGLTRKTSGTGANEVTGFDITTTTDLIIIANNYTITSTGTEEQEWNIEIIFVNLNSDQNANTNKAFSANLIIQEDPIQTRVNLANYITNTLYTEDGVNSLYYHDGIGSYTNASEEAGDNSYRFSGGDYQVTEKAIGEGLTRVYTASPTETDGVVNFYCNDSKSNVGGSCDVAQDHYYTTAYNETVHYNTLEEVLNQAVSDGYITNDNVKNFVCFGPGAESDSCAVDNLYRIIGVFDGQVKLIKYDYANTEMLGTDGDYSTLNTNNFYSGMRTDNTNYYWYYWNYVNLEMSYSMTNYYNVWNYSQLNTVNLNANFWNYLTSEWQNKIANTLWKVGGNTWTNIGTQNAKTVFINEILASNTDIDASYEDEIGLMYVNDYMYAASPNGWTYLGYGNTATDYRAVKGENWLYGGDNEWTISRRADRNDKEYIAYSIYCDGNIVTYGNSYSGLVGVRPVFYLNSDVEIYEGHTGTQTDPYRIVI